MSESKEKFISIYKTHILREGSDKLLSYLEKSDFFTAPASSKFHLNTEGGLCEHSVNVYNNLVDLVSRYCHESVNEESIAIVSLLHDLCKTNYYKKDWKNQKTYDVGKVSASPKSLVKHDAAGDFIWETVPHYIVDEELVFGHGEKSVYIIQSFMNLTREEATAIRYHMGAWREGEANDCGKAFSRFRLAYLAHLADEMSTYLDEGEGT